MTEEGKIIAAKPTLALCVPFLSLTDLIKL